MKLFKRILLGLVILIVFLVIIAFFLPKMVYIERTATINAPPASVYALLSNLKTYDDWMTWNRIDPLMKKQYGDTTAGAGAWYTWESNNSQVGKGKLTITEAIPDRKVDTRLEFEGSNAASGGWELTDRNNITEVKWFMAIDMGNNPIGRWIGILAMDKMIGKEFEKGLSNLKKLAETVKS